MVNFFKGIIFVLLIHTNCLSQNVSDSLNIYFYENEVLIDKVRLIALNKNLDYKITKNLDAGFIFKDILDFKNNIYFLETKCHLVNFPEIDYMEKVNYLEVHYFSEKKKNKFIKIYGDDFFQTGEENFYFSFGLEDIILISYNKRKIKENKRKIKKAREH
jgi:hypothetical protein